MSRKKHTYKLNERYFGCRHFLAGKAIDLNDKTSQADLKKIFDSGDRRLVLKIEENERLKKDSAEE